MQYGKFIAQNRSVQHYKSCPIIGSKGHEHKKMTYANLYAIFFIFFIAQSNLRREFYSLPSSHSAKSMI